MHGLQNLSNELWNVATANVALPSVLTLMPEININDQDVLHKPA